MLGMLYVYTGTDRESARAAMGRTLRAQGKRSIIRITDANSVADLYAALQGGGMFAPLEISPRRGLVAKTESLTGFGGKRAVVLDGIFANEEMRSVALDALPRIRASDDPFFILEGKPDAETRRTLEKHAETFERFDAKKEKEGGEIFALAYALKRGDKKALWVGYQRALLRDEAPEAIHGVLFCGAKDMLLRAKSAKDMERPKELVAELAELPHEARRKGFGLEYALERYILGFNK